MFSEIGIELGVNAWICHNRRMAEDYERLCATGEAFVYAAMTRVMVRRLARAWVFSNGFSGQLSKVRREA